MVGVEVLPDQMLPGAPHPSEETLKTGTDYVKPMTLNRLYQMCFEHKFVQEPGTDKKNV